MTENALVPSEMTGAVGKYGKEEDFDSLTRGSFLPRLQVMQGSSGPVKEKKVAIGNLALIKGKDVIDLGEEVAAIVISWRSKAMDFDNTVSYYDKNSSSFKEIERKSKVEKQGFGVGPEFLIWLVDQKELATLFCASATLQREAPNVKAKMGDKCILASNYIDPPKSKFSWYGIQTKDCDYEVESPDWNLLTEEVNKFNNPPETEVEVADDDDSTGREQ